MFTHILTADRRFESIAGRIQKGVQLAKEPKGQNYGNQRVPEQNIFSIRPASTCRKKMREQAS